MKNSTSIFLIFGICLSFWIPSFSQQDTLILPNNDKLPKITTTILEGKMFRTKNHYCINNLQNYQLSPTTQAGNGFWQTNVNTLNNNWPVYQMSYILPAYEKKLFDLENAFLHIMFGSTQLPSQSYCVFTNDNIEDSKVLSQNAYFTNINNLKIVCRDSQLYYIRVNNEKLFSKDQGITWNHDIVRPFSMVSVAESGLFGVSSTTFYWMNDSFNILTSTPLPFLNPDTLIAKSDTAFVFYKDLGVWRTIDYGSTFEHVSDKTFGTLYRHKHEFFYFDSLKLFKTSDFVQFERIFPTPDSFIHDIRPFLTNSRNEFGVLFEKSRILITKDGGLTWNDLPWQYDTPWPTIISTSNEGIYYGVNPIMSSKDGEHYHTVGNINYSWPTERVSCFDSNSDTSNETWIYTQDYDAKGIFYYEDGYNNFVPFDTIGSYIYDEDIYIEGDNIYIRYGSPEIWYRTTKTPNHQWTALQSPYSNNIHLYVPSLVAFGDTILSTAPVNGTTVYTSLDGGQTWGTGRKISNATFDLFHSQMSRIGRNICVLLPNGEVWVSEDVGNSWTQTSQPFIPTTNTNSYNVQDGILSISEVDYPICNNYLSNDLGKNWYLLRLPNNIPVGDKMWCYGDYFYYAKGNDFYRTPKANLTSLLSCLPKPRTSLGIIPFCPGDTLNIANKFYSQPGEYEVVLQTQLGCDSIIDFKLQYLPYATQPSLTTVSLCGMDSIVVYGKTYYEPVTVNDTIPSIANCVGFVVAITKIIDSPQASLEIVQIVHPTGINLNNGAIFSSVNGGSPIQYIWRDMQSNVVSTTFIASNLVEGGYYLEVLFNYGCRVFSDTIWLSHTLQLTSPEIVPFHISPNPASTFINIEKGSKAPKILYAKLLDIDGRVIITIYDVDINQISLTNTSNSLIILQLVTEDQRVYNLPIVKIE
jgi:hypothetical protein